MIEKVERLNDLIDRQALVDELNAIADEAEAGALVPGVEAFMSIAEVLHLIYAQPTQGDYKMVKHGKWDENDYCTACDRKPITDGFEISTMYNYCPYCGAKMKTEGEDDKH